MISVEKIADYLNSKDFDCRVINFNEIDVISVKLEIEHKQIELIHFPTSEITHLPTFLLRKPSDVGHLAHVLNINIHGSEFGSICVNDRDSVSVNFNMPLLAIEESLNRHIAILKRAMTEHDWNRKELLREFKSCWLNVCDFDDRPVLLTNDNGKLEEIDVYKPVNKQDFGVSSYYLAQSKDTDLAAAAKVYWKNSSARSLAGKAIILPLTHIDPAPLKKEYLAAWYLETLSKQRTDVLEKVRDNYGRWKTHEYWVIFNANVPSGRVWFCLSFKSKKNRKHSLPLTEEQLEHWKVKAVPIRLFNREAVLPRGGASLDLETRRVALVGAGSVGSEIAHKLSAAGVQNLDIYDNDIYQIDNLYRHILPEEYLSLYKSTGLSFHLARQFLWSKAAHSIKRLLDLRNVQLLNSYDLIVIAIGSPTHERLFKEYLLEAGIKVPVINTWLEGFGVGGHATLDIPESAGCLLCAYVCPDTLTRGLSSNLNFIEPNQDITINMSGCGEQFISYGAICSAQTALIASDLAIKFLEGQIKTSSKVSWKGTDHHSKAHGITLTNRFYQFNSSLEIKPLVHEDCDVCN
ncbi:ThiF family adenylyltransferase [Vibrio vulnificus]|uniref:ThiF family adenylyltransferase n=1 Tax=Vibrio vulnificus TaxID=672 RepID=UPI001A2691EA|nr:ThiF family adenylyltransferase [Vibrio vulnificus]ELV8750298.1 ThiF family adenylyltransferase [Vibrio vulnificus]ELV8791830.1 ThiF family adenylyltransferase [Vibrio vulnificus]MCA4016827.1 ThiF family adenylyltransferase [Vibrio vulnificus]HAS6197551.1 ThiF family adenylyltransferase [Vibrio vulnificus]